MFFEGLLSTHKMQMFQWLAYAVSICFLAYTARKVLEALLSFWASRHFHHVAANFDKNFSFLADFENQKNQKKTAENTVEMKENINNEEM